MDVAMITSNLPRSRTKSLRSSPTTRPALLQNRDPQTDCDGSSIFQCPVGTCYSGYDGFIGCCTVTNCRARTTCLEYSQSHSFGLNPDYDGVVLCTNPNAKSCVTVTNTVENQYIMYCDSRSGMTITTGYINLVDTGSWALLPGETAAASTTTSNLPITSSTEKISSSSIPSQTSPSNVFSTATSSTSSGIPVSVPSTAHKSASLSPGAIAGIAIGSLAFLALASIFLIRFVICPSGRRKDGTKYPRGTLGGATLLGSWPKEPERSPEKGKTSEPTSPSSVGMGGGRHRSTSQATVPWSPDDISSMPNSPYGSPELDSHEKPHQSPELDSHELSPRSSTAPSQLEPLIISRSSSYLRRVSNQRRESLPYPISRPTTYAMLGASSHEHTRSNSMPRFEGFDTQPTQGRLPYPLEPHERASIGIARANTERAGIQHRPSRDSPQLLGDSVAAASEEADKARESRGNTDNTEAILATSIDTLQPPSDQPRQSSSITPSIQISHDQANSGGDHPPVSPVTARSNSLVSTRLNSGMSASGSWYGYLSPEDALVHGIPVESGEEDESKRSVMGPKGNEAISEE